MNKVTSKDGTTIAYEKSGTGPAIILIGPLLSTHETLEKLAALLAPKFTAITYDRRGRGQSSDTQPYAVQREVKDIEALIDTAGGSAYLFGTSSSAVLALEAANKLGSKVCGLFMHEPPFIVDDSQPPMPADMTEQIDALIAANRRSDAVKLIFHKGMGIPAVFVTLMRLLMPGWKKMVEIAHTIPYELAVLEGTQTGKPLPSDRWTSVRVPTMVMVGSKSERFFHTGAQAIANLLPHAEYRVLEGGDHGAPMMNPKGIAAEVSEFFAS